MKNEKKKWQAVSSCIKDDLEKQKHKHSWKAYETLKQHSSLQYFKGAFCVDFAECLLCSNFPNCITNVK